MNVEMGNNFLGDFVSSGLAPDGDNDSCTSTSTVAQTNKQLSVQPPTLQKMTPKWQPTW
jgi:hypothetical protein